MKKTKTAKPFKAPKAGPNDQPYEPAFQAECDTCHCEIAADYVPTSMACNMYRRGEKCTGTFIRFGKGAGRGAHFRKVAS